MEESNKITVQIKKTKKEDNAMLATINHVKDLMRAFIGTIVKSATRNSYSAPNLGVKAFPYTLMFDSPVKYGGHDVYGILAIYKNELDDAEVPSIDFFADTDGTSLILDTDFGIETLSEVCTDIANTFGMGDTIQDAFGEVFDIKD